MKDLSLETIHQYPKLFTTGSARRSSHLLLLNSYQQLFIFFIGCSSFTNVFSLLGAFSFFVFFAFYHELCSKPTERISTLTCIHSVILKAQLCKIF
jgi:hypothetical protein